MKKNGILNSELAKVVDDLGHTDTVCISDLGFPVPKGIQKIDLALKHGKPHFQEVLDVYLENVLVQKVFLAEEIKTENPKQLAEILKKLPKSVTVQYLSHEELKKRTELTRAIVRTGEDTTYSNIILESGATL